jgi:hypothetical protein
MSRLGATPLPSRAGAWGITQACQDHAEIHRSGPAGAGNDGGPVLGADAVGQRQTWWAHCSSMTPSNSASSPAARRRRPVGRSLCG